MQPQIEAEQEVSIETIIRKNPLVLEENNKVNKVADFLLPYFTGIEIEGDMLSTYDITKFESVKGILDIKNDNDEQRYKITNGLIGLKALFNLCELLKTNSLPDYLSDIHYHIDFTDVHPLLTDDNFNYVSEYINSELDKWQVTPKYHGARFRRSSRYHTIEYRIGEMTFEYEIIVKRILHCQEISRNVKNTLKLLDNIAANKLKKEPKKEIINAEEIIKQRKVIL